MAQDFPDVEAKSRTALRAWLSKHHDRSGTVWLVTYKKSSPHYLAYEDIVQELLAWGWIDSIRKKVDDERTALQVSPRNPKSAWSAINKAHVEVLRANGQMTPAGERAIKIAQENGMWEFLDDVERLEVPDDLRAALGDAIAVWDTYPRSVKRGTLEWLKTAKRPETRAKRVNGIAKNAVANKRPPPFT